ncbi:MAG: glutamate racemase [Pyrinomonadaceae bacterium MAG19_C2-C3]|nr:glutamate racemase [Pyrinomonadaceae bacterium MAG19_C2-C3]
MNNTLPIGIFDSGVGGLTVYQALHERLPFERFVYLGDTARVPYGTKSLATVERYAVENAVFLHRHGIKMLIVACNTASALALPAIKRAVDVPVVGVIEPGALAAFAASPHKRIGVIATEATIMSHAYLRAITHYAQQARGAGETREDNQVVVTEAACPLFVALAEEGEADGEVARIIAEKYLAPLRAAKVDTLVLGCTHYPILRGVIKETMGANVRLIDSGAATATSVAGLLESKNLARCVDTESRNLGRNIHGEDAMISGMAKRVEGDMSARSLCDDLDHFYVTDAAERFARVAERFLGVAPRVLEAVEVWGQDSLKA